jgi:hypothetical protein
MGGDESGWGERIVTNAAGAFAFGTVYGAIQGAWQTAPNPKILGDFFVTYH